MCRVILHSMANSNEFRGWISKSLTCEGYFNERKVETPYEIRVMGGQLPYDKEGAFRGAYKSNFA